MFKLIKNMFTDIYFLMFTAEELLTLMMRRISDDDSDACNNNNNENNNENESSEEETYKPITPTSKMFNLTLFQYKISRSGIALVYND